MENDIAGLIGETPEAEPGKTKYPRATNIKFYREPVKNVMPGLGDKDTEWDTAAKFFGATSGAELKQRMFQFIAMCADGTITVALNEQKEEAE